MLRHEWGTWRLRGALSEETTRRATGEGAR
jgi:hypothetical protein